MQIKQAIILLGGRGTRLAHLFPDLPKALVPVAGRPFLAWQLDWLFRNNIESVLLAAGYQAEKIQTWIARSALGKNVQVLIEKQPLGTGGAVKFAAPVLTANSFWVLNGDSLLPELNFQKMEENYHKSGALGMMAVTSIENAGRYGAVIFDNNGKIMRFDEKKNRPRSERGQNAAWVNGGVYLFAHSLLSFIDADKNVSLESDVFPRLAAAGELFAFQSPQPLLDMGTPEGLKNTENHLRQANIL